MPSISIRDVEFIQSQKTLYDAFRYAFAFLPNNKFDSFMKFVSLSIDNVSVPNYSIPVACTSVVLSNIIGWNHTIDSPKSDGFISEFSLSNFERWEFFIPHMIKFVDHNSYSILVRLCNYLYAHIPNIFQSQYDMSNLKRFRAYIDVAMNELNNDVQKYHKLDVIENLVKILDTTHLIELCQNYNYIELLMVILRLTKDKDKPKLDFRL